MNVYIIRIGNRVLNGAYTDKEEAKEVVEKLNKQKNWKHSLHEGLVGYPKHTAYYQEVKVL